MGNCASSIEDGEDFSLKPQSSKAENTLQKPKYESCLYKSNFVNARDGEYNSYLFNINNFKYAEDGALEDVEIKNSNLTTELSVLFGFISLIERINILIQHTSLDHLILQYGHFDFTERNYPGAKNKYTMGSQRLDNGDLYIGQINSDEQPDGAGLLFNDSALIEGYFADGKIDGRCRIYLIEGELYQGRFNI